MRSSNGGATERVLNDEMRELAQSIIAKYPNRRSAALPLLFLVQSLEGYVTDRGMKEIAELLDITPAQVLATSSFYTMLKMRPTGEYVVSVCRNISCTHMGARKTIGAIEDHLGIDSGQTTPDGKFTLETAECLATCDGAPSMQINYEDFYRITPDRVIAALRKLRDGGEVRSERGELIRSHREISREVAVAGLRRPEGAPDHARTIGGESPMPDTAPGFRPKEPGVTGEDHGHG